MRLNERDAGRQKPAEGAHIFLGQPSIFFVTVNSKDRKPWLGHPAVHQTLESIWKNKAKAWLVGYYLLMPDHLHLFCAPFDLNFTIDNWITFWKRAFTRSAQNPEWEWQRSSFHHRLRSRVEYEEKLLYVQENPVRKKLATTIAEWKLQGRIHDLAW